MPVRGNMKNVTNVVLPIIVAVISAVGGFVYQDFKLNFFPDQFAGSWLLIGREIGDKPNESRLFNEELELRSSGGVVSGKGGSGGFERVYSGFVKGEHMFLAYVNPTGQGIGALELDEQGGLQKEFSGVWKGKDCTVKRIVECPAILVKGRFSDLDLDKVKKKYASLLDNACRNGSSSACS